MVSAHKAAKRLGVKRTEVYEWLRSTSPPPVYRLGTRMLRFDWLELRAWFESRRVTGPARAPRGTQPGALASEPAPVPPTSEP